MKIVKYVSLLTGLFLVVGIIIYCGAGTPRPQINIIKQNPDQFRNKEITLKGTVVETISLPMVNKGFYQLDDGTETIWVRPTGQVPYRGDKVEVSGELKIGLTIAGKNFGFLLVEKEDEQQ